MIAVRFEATLSEPVARVRCLAMFSGLLVLALLAASGCSRSTTQGKAATKLKEKKPERPFEELRVFTEPNERSSYDAQANDDQRIMLAAKPGHWAGVLVQGQANAFDFDGRLETTPEDAQQRPVDLERSPFWVSTVRPVSLPKAQRKTFETLFFPPRPPMDATAKGSTWIATGLEGRGGGMQLRPTPEMIQHMPNYQYFLVVLAAQSPRYRWLMDLSSVRPPMVHTPANVLDTFTYRVLFPPTDKPLALPSQALCWTSTAYVLWDGVLPAALTPEQQQAMIDWLHWGGGVIVSGPDSLDTLRGSFLEPYLAATGGAAGPLDEAKLAEMHTAWTIDGDESAALGTRAGAAWSGIELVKHPDAEYLPNTAGLVIERRVGRGRVVVTAFRLSELDLVNWPSFDSFFNACLLGRPPRDFDQEQPMFEFVSDSTDKGVLAIDPDSSTGVRFLTRDERDPEAATFPSWSNAGLEDPYAELNLIDQLKAEPGTAAWNDFSWLSNAARESLQEAAGISIPRRTFVLKMIGVYLLVIVPVNWLIFRLVGRVEWAWIAVPVVAIVWGVLVVWLAQLDIGFARAQTEIDVLEIQPDYARAHLTRYTALYSSLTSDYDLRLDNSTAVALPFSAGSTRVLGQSSSGVTLTTVGDRDLRDFSVTSNSTGMVHAEQILPLEGQLECVLSDDGRVTIVNGTGLELSGVALFRNHSTADGQSIAESAWLGDLRAGESIDGQFQSHDAKSHAEHRDAASATQEGEDSSGTLSVRRMMDRVEDPRVLTPGEVRLVAWREGALGDLQVRPSTLQARAVTLVVAHLAYQRATSPRRDANLRPLSRKLFNLPETQLP